MTFIDAPALKGAKAGAAKLVHAQLRKWHSIKLKSESTLTPSGVIMWASRSDPDLICAELDIPEKESKKVKKNLSAFKSALTALDKVEHDSFQRLVEFRSALDGMDCKTHREALLAQAKDEQLPEDVFLLPNLPQLEVQPAVILMREILAIPFASVCFRSLDAVTADMFLRVGTLVPTIKYAVSQSFGALYSRIGLPKEYETRRDESIVLFDISA